MKQYQTVVYGAGIILLLILGYLGLKAYGHAVEYEKHTTTLVSYQSAGEQAKLKLESFAKSLLGSMYDDEKKMKIDAIRKKQQAEMSQAKYDTLYFMLLLALLLLMSWLQGLETFTLFGSLAAMMTLFFGLFSPILMVTIHKEVEYLGDIVLSFESKGVIGSIIKLWEGGDWIVAFVILLFSVLIPILKVTALFLLSLFRESAVASSLVKFFKMIGKWSMVDVFVVAIFLVYLTANKGDVSRAEVEVGLYFFLVYVIVSMLVSVSADKMLKEKGN